MTTARMTSCKDAALYEDAVKLHLKEPSHTTLKWHSADLSNVAAQYEGFLKCFAATGQRINVTMLTRALRAFFKSTPDECKAFAQKMAAVLSHCRVKGKDCNFYTGAKLGPAMLAIIAAMKETGPAALQNCSSSATLDLDVPSSSDEDAPTQAPSTPETGAMLLKRMQEQWGEPTGPAESIVIHSPMSIASSSPEPPKDSADSSFRPADPPSILCAFEPPKPPQVLRRGGFPEPSS